ncbi:MAG TPA: sensory rhodopsin transducer [Thermoanaerobaculia bacterium]|nr:sensory rhodopsin transducer [Thermoanaerobaculia bacterium]
MVSTPAIGRRRWAIAEGYIPSGSTGPEPAMTSHETACILNASDRDAKVELVLFFADREPAGPFRITVPARRTLHLRFNELSEPERVPRDTDFASVITADQPVVVQHTRLDSRRSELALLSTLAYAES